VRCPCGSDSYDTCCGPLHRGEKTAATAEQLMRSRYSAFAVGERDYLVDTWAPRTRPKQFELDALTWVRLEVLGRTRGGLLDPTGTVEFRAHYTDDGQPQEMYENSLFERDGGRWVYVEPLAVS
jgi:SEC-C motif-containing protein